MPCSGLTGAGLKDPVDPSVCPWYRCVVVTKLLISLVSQNAYLLVDSSGKPFIPFIDEMPPLQRMNDRPFLMPIVDKYKDMGTVVLGKVEAGEARKGQTLVVLPNKVVER